MTDAETERAQGPRRRRGLIGPFTGRQLLSILGIVVVGYAAIRLGTAPIAAGPGGVPTAIPGATPFVVGPAVEGLRPGDLAPDLVVGSGAGGTVPLADLDGNPLRLSDLRGGLVWLNFWATWCPPCQAETPVLREMDEAYRDRGLTLVAVAVQETTVDDVRAYAARYELGYRIAFDASADVFRRYRVFALPTQVFIGPDGRILGVVNGPLDAAAARARINAWLPAAGG